MIHLLGLAVCVAVVTVSKVQLKRERKIHEKLERKLIARKRVAEPVPDGRLN